MRRSLAAALSVLTLLGSMLIVTGVAVAANPAANLDQCANLAGNGVACSSTRAGDWVNGNLGASKARYNEGDSVPYRMRFANLATGASAPVHKVTIEWDTTKGGKHALDYLTTWDRTVTSADPLAGVAPVIGGTPDTRAIPADTQVTGAGVTPIAGVFTLWGGSITNVSTISYFDGTGFSGDKSARLTVSFTADVANPVLAWGGHIATRLDWGLTSSAVTIPGSPYHMRLIDLDGAGGNQDRSLSNEAVTFPGYIHIVKDTTGGNGTFDFIAGPSPLSNFSITTVGGTGSHEFNGITTFTTYTVSESSLPAHWTFDGTLTCAWDFQIGGSFSVDQTLKKATINLQEGEEITCTYENTHQVVSPTISTQVKNTNGTAADTDIANNGHVSIGTVAYDTATFTGATSDVTGTVTYYVVKGATCTGGTSLGAQTIDATTHLIPASDTYTFETAGTYRFWAVYSGDANNNEATSGCSTEIVVTDKNSPTLLTQVRNTNGAAADTDIANGASVSIGTVAYDTATFSGASNPTGTVTYYVIKGETCTTTGATSLGAQTIDGTTHLIPDSNTYTFTSAGTYRFWAVYGGDANNTTATSGCSTEVVVVDKNTTTTSTAVKKTIGNTPVADGGTIAIGESIYDTATLGNPTSDAGGTVTYYYELQDPEATAPVCTAGTQIGLAKTVSAGLVPQSDGVSFSAAGTYELWAVYSGDDNNLGSTSTCGSETVVVAKNTPGVSTTPTLLPNDSVTISNLAAPGSGGYGNLVIELRQGSDCTGTILYSRTFTPTDLANHFTGNGTYATNNASVFITGDALIRWCTTYTGDANNAAFGPDDTGEVMNIDFNPVGPAGIFGLGFGLAFLLRRRTRAA